LINRGDELQCFVQTGAKSWMSHTSLYFP
jgi:hypothetical protein